MRTATIVKRITKEVRGDGTIYLGTKTKIINIRDTETQKNILVIGKNLREIKNNLKEIGYNNFIIETIRKTYNISKF